MNIKSYSKELFNYDNGLLLDNKDSVECFKGGKGSTYTPPPSVNPTPPVEEASVAIEEEDDKKKTSTSKADLKIPLAKTADTGLKV